MNCPDYPSEAAPQELDSFLEPAGNAKAEMKIKRSLFIARLFPCRSAEEGRGALGEVESEHKNATHSCWAYRLGPEPESEHFSDAGEPAGTAGRPILTAIKQSGMVNLIVIVTRYFGGVKLGVRGLIDAYGQAARAALSLTGKVSRTRSRSLAIRFPYAIIKEITHMLNTYGTSEAPVWNYGIDVEVTANIRLSSLSRVESALDEFQAVKRIFSWSWLPDSPILRNLNFREKM